MKRGKIKKILDKLRHMVDKEFAKKLKKEAEIIETLKNLKERQDVLKESIKKESDSQKLRRLVQELEIVKTLRKKAKQLLQENKDNK